MKKNLLALSVSMMCVFCLALAACGNSGSPSSVSVSASASTGASASAASSASASTASLAENVLGNWKLAAVETQGVTVAGDFSNGVFGNNVNMQLSFAEGGKGSGTFGSQSAEFSWSENGADSIVVKPTTSEASVDALTATYADGVLSFAMSDNEFSGTLMMTKDGTLAGFTSIDLSQAKPITSADQVTGTWKLSSMVMTGLTMFGDADALSGVMGGSIDASLTLNADGSAQAMGTTVTWTVGADGATIDMGSGISAPLMILGDDLMVNASALLGGTEFAMIFSK